ncbi:MAG: hypothetical protein ACRDGH_00090 [Candidatus Limnocylindria bacterium]
MTQDTLECASCGNANPGWAQICRSCGAPMTATAAAAAAEPSVITEGSLMAIGAALGTIALAVVIGLVFGGILPPAPPVAAATPTPSASVEPTAEPTPDPSGGSPVPSASVGPVLPGTLTFGLGLNAETQRVTNPTDTFTPGTTFAHSIELTAPFGVTQLGEEVARINEDGSETIVITTENQVELQDPNATVDGFTVPTNALLEAIGAGTYVMRVYRGTELLAQGTFILAE